MKIFKIQLFLMLVIAINNLVSAQQYNFKNFTEKNGLPQQYIYNISKSPKGLLYIATSGGLYIYNSKNFKALTIKNGLAENFISTLFFDSKETCWIGHFQKGISFIKNKKISIIKSKNFENTRITCIAEDDNKNILVGTLGNGLFKIDSSNQVTKINTISSDNITSLCVVNSILFVGSLDGLSSYQIDSNYKQISEYDTLLDTKITAIKKDAQSNILVSTNGSGIFLLKKSNKKYSFEKIICNEQLNKNFNDFYVIGNEIWIATFGNGIVKYKFKNFDYQSQSIQNYDSLSGLTSKYIQNIFVDDEANIWIGTYGGGLFQLLNEQFSFYTTLNNLSQNSVTAIATDNKNNLWLGHKTGLEYYDIHTKKSIKTYNSSTGFINDAIQCLRFDNNNRLWIGTEKNGIFYKKKNSDNIENISKKFKLNFKCIKSIEIINDNITYIGTTEGLIIIDNNKKSATTFTTTQGLTHNVITHLFKDKLDRVWFACHGSGPFYYHNGEFTVFKDIDKLRSYNINSITQDKNGMIWIATEGDGIFKFDDKKFINYNTANGLISNYCYSIIVDDNNTVWVGSKNGISYLPKSATNFLTISNSNSLWDYESNMNATNKDKNGNIWFGTENGVLQYNPNSELINSETTNTIIESVTINEKIYNTNKLINLKYGKYQLKITPITICYSNNTNTKYRYKFEGYDDKWVEISNNIETIIYPKLEDGNYEFKIQASNRYGNWNNNFTNFTLNIEKPFWKKSWFIFSTIIAFVLSIRFYSNYKTKSLLKKQKELEKLVQEKTIEVSKKNILLEEQKHKLEITNSEITDSITYAKRIQDAILPTQTFDNYYKDLFIFFSPRDIVSGDFYWQHQINNNEFIVAVADCTGHGVPGAFLTMMGTTLLNKIIKEGNITTPSEILFSLDENVRESLHQNSENATKDGMDVAICKINLHNNTIEYSGACRPLILVRENEITEFRPSFYSIGYYNDGVKKLFENYTINTQKNDCIYIFSDGYADQFGGNNKQKFMTKNLKELFSKISSQPISSQKMLVEETFTSWKGNNQQTDDILVIGIRLS